MGVLESIAIIPDGNRRFAKKHGLPLEVAYGKGFERVGKATEWALEERLKWLGFWALSLENYRKRSSLELRTLFKLMQNNIRKAMMGEESEVREKGVRIRFFGRLELLPDYLRASINELERKTQENDALDLNVGVAYSGQDELVQASKALAADIRAGKVDERALESDGQKIFYKYLYFQQSPDLVVRTGDVQRLSGFLPYQSAYSEYYFSKKLWPEFGRADFRKAVEYYENTQRRFGR